MHYCAYKVQPYHIHVFGRSHRILVISAPGSDIRIQEYDTQYNPHGGRLDPKEQMQNVDHSSNTSHRDSIAKSHSCRYCASRATTSHLFEFVLGGNTEGDRMRESKRKRLYE